MWTHRGQRRPAFADEPGPGQESVWDYPRPPVVVADSRRVQVRAGDRLIANSSSALRILETASPPTFYIPARDVGLQFLQADSQRSYCEWKGEAAYWRLAEEPGRGPVGWSYASPRPAFAAIAGYFSFYPGRVECFVDDEPVRPQAGGFYGGWITSDVAGPFKGDPGTGGW